MTTHAKRRTVSRNGDSRSPEYRVWQTMRLRCANPANAAYASYGGRGITVCERWRDDFSAFLADMGRKPSPAHEIDRINNDRGYEPSNCRWATRSENDRNRRSNVWVEYRGERRLLVDLCEQFSMSRAAIDKRLAKGWSVERALTEPIRPKARNGCAVQVERAPRPPTASGVRGVTWVKSKRRWKARVSVGGVRRELGLFWTIDAAAAALVRANVVELERTEAAS